MTTVTFEPDVVEATHVKAVFDPNRLTPPTGPDAPVLTVYWIRGTPHDWFRVDYSDPNAGFHAGWHQDETHPELGRAHFQYATAEKRERKGTTFVHETPSLLLWEIVGELLEHVIPTYSSRDR